MSDELAGVDLGEPDELSDDGFQEAKFMAVVQVHGLVDTESADYKQHAGDTSGSTSMLFVSHDDALDWVKWMVLAAHGGEADELTYTTPVAGINHVMSEHGPTHGYVIGL